MRLQWLVPPSDRPSRTGSEIDEAVVRAIHYGLMSATKENNMAKGEQKGNRESKKPKKDKVKTIAAAPSQKGASAGWQPTLGSGKKK